MKKLIVFILAAVLISCSKQETLKVKHKENVKKESKVKDYYEQHRTDGYGYYFSYRSLDTIKISGEYVIVAVYKYRKGISTVVIGRTTKLD